MRGIMEGIKSISIIGTARDFDELKALFQTKRNIEEVIQTQDDHEQSRTYNRVLPREAFALSLCAGFAGNA